MFGFAIGAAFPGLLGALFLALPIFFLVVALFATGTASRIFAFTGHPAIAIVVILALVFLALRTVGWLSGRFPRPSAIMFAVIYALFYGGMAFGISGEDWIWAIVIGGAAGGYIYHKSRAALLHREKDYELSAS